MIEIYIQIYAGMKYRQQYRKNPVEYIYFKNP